jgi:diacylglycerol kinase family enzyme
MMPGAALGEYPRAVGALLIVNPFASGVGEARLAAVQAALPAGTETVLTQGQGHATSLARESDGRTDAIYVFSGDGTYNEVLNAVTGETPLGFIPGGGTSVLPRALGLPRDPVQAAAHLAAGTRRRIGLGRVNGRRFGFGAGIGLDAELVRRVDEMGRSADGRRPGDLAFAWAGVRLLAEKRVHLEPSLVVEGLGRAALVLVANCRPYSYAGALALDPMPRASFDAGLDVIAPERVRARDLPRLVRLLVRGQDGASGVIAAHDLDRLVVQCDRALPLQVDGEDLGDVEAAVFEAEHDAVAVLV